MEKILTALVKFLASLCLTFAVVQFKEDRRYFFDSEGWRRECRGRNEPLVAERGSLIGRDEGREVWYFSAPEEYIVQLKCAFSLQFR